MEKDFLDNHKAEIEYYGSYIIRIYDQSLCIDWIDKGGYSVPKKYITKKELVEDLKNSGLKIIKFSFSSFSSCYFFEVEGEYKGKIDYQKLDINAKDFCWDV